MDEENGEYIQQNYIGICKLDGEATLPQICLSSSSFSSTIKCRQIGSCIEVPSIGRVGTGVRIVFISYPDSDPDPSPSHLASHTRSLKIV